ncbi:MAG: nucleotidyltransferase domain-containing protein [Chloroflexi bacterium]|nr:MAG: nucleotidyltransferase domain-containing protein [Chloroflexota bacterium]
MNKAIDTIIKQFKRKLGGQLQAIFLYGSYAQGFYQEGESDINLCIVVEEGTNIHALRRTFLPIWEDYGQVLQRAPLLAPHSAFVRHMQLNPLLAHHIARDGKQLFGAPDFLDSILPPLDVNEAYAYMTNEAMQVSKVLTPELLEPEEAEATRQSLQRIVRRIRREPLTTPESSKQLLARVYHFLNPIIHKLPVAKQWMGTKPSATTSPILPGLQALYKETGKMILVFSQLTPQTILRTDWSRISESMGKQYLGIEVTSTVQLCLSAMFERPLDVFFRKFEHNWGPDFLPALTLSPHQIFRQAARLPSHIQVDSMPNAVLTQDDTALNTIIHDFQNKLLNVQLEHELLCRFEMVERFTPPEPLPGRDTPPTQRIVAIFKHLQWWADYYAGQLKDETA